MCKLGIGKTTIRITTEKEVNTRKKDKAISTLDCAKRKKKRPDKW